MKDLFRQWFAPRRRTPGRTRQAPPALEHLQERCLPATGIFFDAATGVITIEGSASSDNAKVSMDYGAAGTSADDQVVVTLEHDGILEQKVFKLSDVVGAPYKVIFHGYGGDDTYLNETALSSKAFGDGGKDSLTGGGGKDYLVGGSGDDTLLGDYFFVEMGDADTIYGDYDPATFRGPIVPSGNDYISGLWGDDKMYGQGGNDVIYGLKGNDLLDGGTGNDQLYEFGTYENNTLVGGAGNDTLEGGYGSDVLSGGAGDDTLKGGSGKDFLYGNDGNDLLDGGDDGVADHLEGGAGADQFQKEMYWNGFFWANRDAPVDFSAGDSYYN